MPQIEVTFDIDANGILNVSARDKDTGAEQAITISESSNLDQAEVERMIADAERNRAEDARLRAARSTPATSSTRSPTRWSGGWPSSATRSRRTSGPAPRCWSTDARQAVKEEAPLDRVRSLTAELQQVLHGPRRRRGQPAASRAGRPADGRRRRRDDDDVIDADFTVPSERS